jgi:hypothetical protein
MAELPPRYPASQLTNEITKRQSRPSPNRMQKKRTENMVYAHCRSSQPLSQPLCLLHTAPSSGRELPDFSNRPEVHHRLVPLFHGKQLRDLHVSASARFSARRFSHRLPWSLLLVSPPGAVAEEVFPRLGRAAYAAAPPGFVVRSLAELFQLDSSGCMPAL